MNLLKKINLIRKISLSLFFFSLLALLGSLWLQNTITSFKYTKGISNQNSKLQKIEGLSFRETVNCAEKKESCESTDPTMETLVYSDKLGDCFLNNIDITYFDGTTKHTDRDFMFKYENKTYDQNELKKVTYNKKIELEFTVLSKNDECIGNSKIFSFYKLFPYYHEFIYSLKYNPKTKLGTNEKINPFLYGEVSISNIVKRFPINYVFKTLLFISVILMYLYWNSYKYLFSEILSSKKEMFVFFGIGSAVFLFFHVLFLGMEIDNKIFKLIRRLIIVFFILFEIVAQTLLSIKLYKNKNIFNNYCHPIIINTKLTFVIIVALISLCVITILLLYNLSSKVDYILEWNYFAALLFYYLLSFLMWKKIFNS